MKRLPYREKMFQLKALNATTPTKLQSSATSLRTESKFPDKTHRAPPNQAFNERPYGMLPSTIKVIAS